MSVRIYPNAGAASVRPTPLANTFTDPDDVVSEPTLTWAEKKALLASWISDARAVENAPAQRRLDSGAFVEIEAIRQAMAAVDRSMAAANDNNGDPPPAQPGAAIPFSFSTVLADGVVRRRVRRAA